MRPRVPAAAQPGVYTAVLRRLTGEQYDFVTSPAKRKVVRAGRRGGKTVGAAMKAIQVFGERKRVLYAVPTAEQVAAFWYEVTTALREPIAARELKVNETEHSIEAPGTRQRIRAKTAWNADTLRGDFADLLILDEWQLMNEDAWDVVGMPMLADNDGDAIFIYTPPSLRTKSMSKARDPRYAAKMFKKAQEDKTGRWAAFHFTSYANVENISEAALNTMAEDMSQEAFRREILAEDDDEDLGILVYSCFDDSTQLISPFEIPRTWPRLVGHDFGQANPAALFIAQNPGPTFAHGMAPGDYVIYEEYLPGAGVSVDKHVEAFKGRTEGMNVVARVGGNRTTEDEIRQGYGAHGWPISAPRVSNPGEQINRVKILMEHNKVFIFRICLRLREEMTNCTWQRDSEGYRLDKIQNEARFHLLAALRYVLSYPTPETALDWGKPIRVINRLATVTRPDDPWWLHTKEHQGGIAVKRRY